MNTHVTMIARPLVVGFIALTAIVTAALPLLVAHASVGATITSTIRNGTNSSITTAQFGTLVHDSVTVASSTASTTPTGTVNFNLYADTICSATTSIQAAVPLVNGFAQSATTTVPNTGLSFRADYSGDATNTPTISICEPLIATASSTILTTALSTTSVSVSSSVFDAATLSAATAHASGTIAYNVYTNNTCTLGAESASTVAVVNGIATSSNAIVFNNPGTFYWQAFYSGDPQNAAATSSCQSEVLSVATATPGHIIVDEITNPSNDPTSFGFTAGGAGYTNFNLTDVTAPNNQALAPGTYSISQPTVAGWTLTSATCATNGGAPVTYTPGTSLVIKTGDTVSCVFTNTKSATAASIATNIVNGNNISIASAAIGSSMHDTATVTSNTASSTPTGTVDFSLFGNTTCAGEPTLENAVPLVSGFAQSATTTIPNTGLSYLVHYNGDATNTPITSACEVLTAGIQSTSIATTLSSSTVVVGTGVHDSATLVGTTGDATGTVAYNVYSDNACTAGKQSAGTTTVALALVPNSNTLVFNAIGTFYWQAAYSGDLHNAAATSSCVSEALTVVATTTPPVTGPNSIGGAVYNDQNNNNFKDASDPKLAGWTVWLHQGSGYSGPIIATAITDASGNYSFPNLALGTYFVEENEQTGWTQTTSDMAVTLTTAFTAATVNFANVVKGTNGGGDNHHGGGGGTSTDDGHGHQNGGSQGGDQNPGNGHGDNSDSGTSGSHTGDNSGRGHGDNSNGRNSGSRDGSDNGGRSRRGH